ncbi:MULTISPECIES: APC family permease [Bacillus]|uniref:Amino acid permease n=1 Tax=Bacillus pseudomycoides TaxID=64104 RepID=A0A1Y3MPU1_9BACI|nr:MULTISPECIES: APC family permease [Bacillus cereus group]EOP49830.1 amino acid permease [Bacillus cereus VD136]EOP65602.1 amino acid permease [Bacillus cereus VDM006]EOQ02369.1 amino acid permease [Bacillus cereus VDM021]MDF2085573.1 APC family permease [Bacillus pseudomycoides]OUM49592.1 amino acid permease [Bacillus pseudomycoides]
MFSTFKRLLIGRPLKSTALGEQKLNKLKALAILSSDALSSVAYGTEQILIVLAAFGAIAFWYSIPIAIGVLILLTALILSYRQIIFSYPHGGGAYVVSKKNLGTNAGLIAGGSLLVDYILTVAVSVSAGTDAITSAFPTLHTYTVPIAIILVLFITILNLRGVTESASILAYPVYLFAFALVVLIIAGVFKIIFGQAPANLHTPIGTVVPGITLFFLLKAFSSGCSALTGVEAISNAIPNFKEPAAKNAAKTLVIMGTILAILFTGITFLAYWYGIAPKHNDTVVSQIASNIFGRNFVYYFIQGTTALILVLAANTGFSAFPLLAFNLASDKYMPRMYLMRGDRLGYSNGIITLGIGSILLIIAFQGKTEQLIPLYAVGVFIPFTLSQTGMIIKWLREKPQGWLPKLLTNLLGALISLTVLLIFFITKFAQVWSILIFLPIIVFIFHRIHNHYVAVGEQLRINFNEIPEKVTGNIVIVPIAGITKVVEQSINYAETISDQVIAVYVAFDKESELRMQEKWKEWQPNIRLVTFISSYRSLMRPIAKLITIIQHKAQEKNRFVTVLIPQFITKKNWHNFLHNQSSVLLRVYLLYKKNVIVTTVPYRFRK